MTSSNAGQDGLAHGVPKTPAPTTDAVTNTTTIVPGTSDTTKDHAVDTPATAMATKTSPPTENIATGAATTSITTDKPTTTTTTTTTPDPTTAAATPATSAATGDTPAATLPSAAPAPAPAPATSTSTTDLGSANADPSSLPNHAPAAPHTAEPSDRPRQDGKGLAQGTALQNAPSLDAMDIEMVDVDVDVSALPEQGQQDQGQPPQAPHAQQQQQPQEHQQPQANVEPLQPAGAQTPVAHHTNHNPFDMSFPRTPINPMDSSAFMAMALARMAGDQFLQHHHMAQPPSTVTPSQVTLPNPMPNGGGSNAMSTIPEHNNHAPADPASEGLESFARIEFADSVFQMTTYAVIIGRDQRAMEQARRDEKRAEEYRKRAEENARLGLPPPSPIRQEVNKFSKSYVSEEGGMLGPESDSDDTSRPRKKRKTSTNGSSQQQKQQQQQHQNQQHERDAAQENLISNRQYVAHTPGAAAVDLASLRPSPYHVPVIGIHSPGPDIASKTKAISREHMRIQFNKEQGVFEAIPLHKNGFFVGDVLHKEGVVVLRSGDHLQIKDVDFRFIINGVPEGKTGAEDEAAEETRPKNRYSYGGKEMSFEFEAAHGNGNMHDTSDSSSLLSPPAPSDDELFAKMSPKPLAEKGAEAGASTSPGSGAGSAATTTADTGAGPAAAAAASSASPGVGPGVGTEAGPKPVVIPPELAHLSPEQLLEHGLLHPMIPKKRGPGRPPKNGIMSKREQRLLKKQQQELAKKTLPQPPPGEPPPKRKVGRPRKHPLPEDGSERPEKRKYKPRKPKEEGGEGSEADARAKERKDKKARPKSPPLELKIEDYTEEQLQKPNKNYGVLIDETLTAAHAEGRTEGLTLKQIYKRITLRYPWFYFHTETKGWESSVRHNLIGNDAFKKDETTGLWSRVPGVELDAGKKRKQTSPDRNVQTAYANYGHTMYPQYAGAPHMPPPGPQGYQHQQPQGYHHGQAYAAGQQPQGNRHPQYLPPATAPPAPGQQPHPAVPPHPVAPAQVPGYGPSPSVPQAPTYSSPYASRPPPTNIGVKAEDGTAMPAPMPAASSAQTPAGTTFMSASPHNPGAGMHPTSAGASRVTQTPPVQPQPRHVIDPRLFRSIVGLKNGLIDNLKKAKNPKAEAIVMSALNRSLGLKTAATENPAMEDICMRGIQKLLDGFTGHSKSPTPGDASSTPKPSTPGSVFDPKVLNALVGFKNVSVNALKASVGEDRAEAVALSALDRVLGLAEASIVPPRPSPKDGSPPPDGARQANHEVLETRLMGTVKQLLLGLHQKLPGT